LLDSFANVIILALRIGVVVVLYTFILLVFRALQMELMASSRSPEARSFEPSEWLEVVDCDDSPGLLGKLYPLQAISSIGRDPGNTITIPDRRLSAQHARIIWRDGYWWVEDLGSTNGTMVNGNPVTRPTRFGRNDILRLGPASLRMRSA